MGCLAGFWVLDQDYLLRWWDVVQWNVHGNWITQPHQEEDHGLLCMVDAMGIEPKLPRMAPATRPLIEVGGVTTRPWGHTQLLGLTVALATK